MYDSEEFIRYNSGENKMSMSADYDYDINDGERKMSDTPEFVNGLMIKPPHEKAPDFVKCAISIRREELMTFLMGKTDEWINIDVKSSKKTGKWYAQVNHFKPESRQDVAKQQSTQGSNQGQQTAPQVDPNFDDTIPL